MLTRLKVNFRRMVADSLSTPEQGAIQGVEERPVETLYLACPSWLWRMDDLAQGVRFLADGDLNLGLKVVHADSEICFGNVWEQKKQLIDTCKLLVARPDLKPALAMLDSRDVDVFVEVGYAIARGVPTSWLLHPSDEQLPFMVQSHEAVIQTKVIDAIVGLKGHLDRAVRRPPFEREQTDGVFFSAPYSDHSANRFQLGIASPLKAAGFMPFFAKHSLGPGDAPKQALEQIARSRCLIADVSTRSQNVAFEIGFALGLGINVMLIRHQTAPSLEGNLAGLSCFVFESAADLRAKIEQATASI